MFRPLYVVALSAALLAASTGASAVQDPPKEPPKKDPKAASPQKAAPATDEEAEAALAEFKKSMTADLASSQVAAIKTVSKVRHEKVIRAVAGCLRSNLLDVAACAALQLAELDHPVSAEVLVQGIAPNDKRPVVLGAIFNSLGKLGYESASGPLVSLLDKSNEDGWKKVLEEAVNAVGRIGSAKAVDPLLDWRRRQPGGGFGGGRWGGGGGGGGGNQSGRLWSAIDRALKSITGGDEETTSDWEKWWKANRADLVANATATYRCKVSWERYDGPAGRRNPCPHAPDKGHTSCSQGIRVRLIPEPDAPADGGGPPPGGGGGNP
ncbi:MAG TPA: HEAT repeat domain-containing protein [Planctomycetota bacterium]|nr:HEAT repeat domain-containing protein [Planctomycetota bacterium]